MAMPTRNGIIGSAAWRGRTRVRVVVAPSAPKTSPVCIARAVLSPNDWADEKPPARSHGKLRLSGGGNTALAGSMPLGRW